MRNVNPAYLIALVIVILLGIWFQKHQTHQTNSALKNEIKELRLLGKEIKELKSTWITDSLKSMKLKQIIDSSVLKKSSIKMVESGESIIISGNKLSIPQSKFLVSKILNDSFSIKKINLNPVGKSFVSVLIEVKL